MGKFTHLTIGKSKEVKLGDVVYTIRPLTARYLSVFMSLNDAEDKAASMRALILASLQQTDATITLADIDEIPIKEMATIMEAVMDVNEMK
jgi:hypothetical protein